MPARRIDTHKHQRILELHKQGLGCKAIAREAGVSPSTVSKVCNEAGLTFDRTKTMVATKALVADAKHRRAVLADGFLDDAARLRGQMFSPVEYIDHGGKDYIEVRWHQDEPTPTDKLKLAQALDVLLRRHEALVAMDTDHGAGAAESVLDRLAEGIANAVAQQQPEANQ
jgi:lambda repressor-like predicted transcriptional regulator